MTLLIALVVFLTQITFQPSANAATSGTGVCQQTYTFSAGNESVEVTSSGNYCYVAFKNLGGAGSASSTYSWTKPSGVSSLDVLVVGGGGGGGARHGGGGGAGSFVEATSYPVTSSSTNISVVVGSGGAGATGGSGTYVGLKGNDSSFKIGANGLTSLGGGAGINGSTATVNGGSGGGAGAVQIAGTATTTTQKSLDGTSTLTGIEFGSAGATGVGDLNSGTSASKDFWAAGGGGGAGGAGKLPTLNGSEYTASNYFPDGTGAGTRGGDGGIGKVSSIISSAVATTLVIGQSSAGSAYFAAGGGGGIGADADSGGTGGIGGGGNGTKANAAGGNAATASTGSGGGGSGFDDISPVAGDVANPPGGAGGSGFVLIRYAIAPAISVAPVISGSTSFGQILTSTDGTWSYAPTSYTYQWSRAVTSGGTYTNISGATNATYTLVSSDIGQYLKITITATNTGGTSTSTSAATSQIAKASPTFSTWSDVSKTFGDANYIVTPPTVTGSLPGTLSYSSGNAAVISISGTTFAVTGGGSAVITATFTPTDTTNYNVVTTTNNVNVGKAAQLPITITSTSANMGINLNLTSTGGSTGGSFIYTKVSGSCTVAGAILTPTASGSCVIQSTLLTNANYFTETSTATTITIARSSATASISLQAGVLVFRQSKTITAVTTVAGKVTFRVNGKKLAGCINKDVSALNSYTVTCAYTPSTRGYITITTSVIPTDVSYIGTTNSTERLFVTNRSGTR